MKITTDSSSLLAELQTVSRVASTRSAIQALSGVQLVADDGGAQLRATDMEIGLRVPLTAEVQRPGSVVLPARLMLDVARALPAKEVSLELRPSEQDVEIISGSATFHIRTLRAEDFPPLPEPSGENTLSVPAPAFVDTIAKVARSASRDETRPILTGILVSASGSELKMVATDSYRLSVKETPLQEPLSGGFEANVPARALQELARIAQQADAQTLQVSVLAEPGRVRGGRHAAVVAPDRWSVPELSPAAARQRRPRAARLGRRAHRGRAPHQPARAEERAAAAVLQRGRGDRLGPDPDVGEASESLPVDFHGEPLEIGFNPEFLRDGLESVESGDLVIKLISPLRPGLIESADGSGFVYLIMPIRLNV